MERTIRVFVSAGEASGDAYGAALVHELGALRPSCVFEAIGGRKLSEAGATLVADSSHWGAIGIWQSFLVALSALGAYYRVKRRLARGNAGLFVAIDFGYMNVRLCRHAKGHGWKVLYFVPPASWRRDRQGADLPALTDAIVTPFPWSAEILKRMGADAHWFGHPIKQLLRDAPSQIRGHGIAVLPGSRTHEIDNNLPLIAQSVDGPVEFALAPSVDRDAFVARWRRLRPDASEDLFTVADTPGVLRRARAAIVCSGTATLEAALSRTTMVVIYRASRAMEIEEKIIRFKRPKFISLPNIVLDRLAVPELIQEGATPETLRAALKPLLEDSPERASQLEAFEELDSILGADDAITKAAQIAIGLTTPAADRPRAQGN